MTKYLNFFVGQLHI